MYHHIFSTRRAIAVTPFVRVHGQTIHNVCIIKQHKNTFYAKPANLMMYILLKLQGISEIQGNKP